VGGGAGGWGERDERGQGHIWGQGKLLIILALSPGPPVRLTLPSIALAGGKLWGNCRNCAVMQQACDATLIDTNPHLLQRDVVV